MSAPRPALGVRFAAVLAYGAGAAGQAVFAAYVVGTGLGRWPRGEPADGAGPWLVDGGWLVLFAVQHSGMARAPFKAWLARFLPAALERSAYVATSGVILGLMMLTWQPLPGEPLWHGPDGVALIGLAAAAGGGLCCLWFDHAGFFGLRQAGVFPPAQGPEALRIEGPYRWVRHPLMLAFVVFLWVQPRMPPELLLLAAGLTAYILLALPLEERELVRRFGAAYEEYRRRVPALVPWKGPLRP